MNITNTVVLNKNIILPDAETLESPDYIPEVYATVYWTIVDGNWTYMDTYLYDETEWTNTTSTDLQNRQVAQYVSWREYCQSPVTELPEITSTTVEEII